jgi:hypothetical protein
MVSRSGCGSVVWGYEGAKIQGEKNVSTARENRGNGKKERELNDLSKYWAKLNVVFGV